MVGNGRRQRSPESCPETVGGWGVGSGLGQSPVLDWNLEVFTLQSALRGPGRAGPVWAPLFGLLWDGPGF